MWLPLLGFLLFPLISDSRTENRRFSLIITDNICRNETDGMLLYNCDHKRVRPNVYTFSNLFIFAKDYDKDFMMHLLIDAKFKTNAPAIRIFDISFNLCHDVMAVLQNPYARFIIEEMQKTSNFPIRCPIKSNLEYRVTNFTLSNNNFPAYMPDAPFTVTGEFLDKNVVLLSQTVKGRIASDRYIKKPG